MISRIRLFVFLPVVLSLAGVAYYYTGSALDHIPPELQVLGIEDDHYYTGTIACTLVGSDAHKIREISIELDDKELVPHQVINRKKCEYPFTLDAQALAAGKHMLKICAIDGSLNKNKTDKELSFFVDNLPLQAAFVRTENDYRVFQGHTLHVQFQANKPIKEAFIEGLSRKYQCFPESPHSLIYECFFPISCDEAPNEYLFRIVVSDQVGNDVVLENKFHVVIYPFKKQSLVVSADKIKEEQEAGLSEKQFEKDIAEISSRSELKKLWSGSFDVPLEVRGTSTDFGTLRVTQDRGKYRHSALDLLGAPRSVVWAPADGKVVMKARYAHSGNTVVLDHGCGVLSLFFHLDSFAPIEVGDMVKKGNPLGTLGKTGYASGYHLHWEQRLYNTPINPMEWTKHDF